MAKLITGVIVLHILVGFLAGIYQGGGGYVVHALASAVDDNDLALELDTTVNFYAPSTVTIGTERIAISAIPDNTHLTVAANGRGLDGTTAIAHYTGEQVYTEESAMVGGMIQTRIARIADASGPLFFLDIAWQILGIAQDIIVSPFTFFGTDLWILSAIYAAIIAGIIVVMGLQVAGSRRV
jgi:hypothetical protein